MPYYADCYVLVNSRNPDLVNRLLERYLPGLKEETAVEYEIPQYANEPALIFKSASELMEYLKEQPNQVQFINWISADTTNPTQVGVYYTSDGAMILCVAVPAEDKEEQVLNDVLRFFDATVGYIAYEAPPPDTASEFTAIAASGRT